MRRRTQEDLARKGLGLTTIKKIEREGCAELRSFFRLADALEVSVHTLFEPPGTPIQFRRSYDGEGLGAIPLQGYIDGMKRRDFVIGVPSVLAALAAPPAIRELFAPSNRDRAPSTEQVQRLAAYCDDLRLEERQVGGAALCGIAMTIHHQLETWMGRGGASEQAYREMQLLHGNLSAWIGWLGYDAERLDLARSYSEQAASHGMVIGCSEISVRAMDNLAMLWTRLDSPRRARDVANAALRLAGGTAPQVQAVLSLRLAKASASMGDQAAAARAIDAAMNFGEVAMSRAGGSVWADWADSTGILSSAGKTLATYGSAAEAIPMLEAVLARPRKDGRVAKALDSIALAHAYAQHGELDRAGALGSAVLPEIVVLDSRRTLRRLGELYAYFAQADARASAVAEFMEGYETTIDARQWASPVLS